MAILWCGGEDVDFPNGGAVLNTTNTAYFRTAYARCNIYANGVYAYSNAFPGGAVTSAWISYQYGFFPENSNGSFAAGGMFCGLGNTANTNGAGIYVQVSGSQGLSIAKYDGTTVTALATGAGFLGAQISIGRIDMQVLNYGASSTINLYLNGNFYIGFSGSSTISGLTNFNCVNLRPSPSGNFGVIGNSSEIIVTDTEPTMSMSLKTSAPVALGTTANWTGVVGSVNPVTITDANNNFVNSTTQDQQYTQGGLPAGSWGVRLVKVTSRAAVTSGSTPTHFTPGFNIAGTPTLVGGTLHTPPTTFTDYEDFWTTNPATSTAWVASDLATGNLQLEFRSS